MKKHRLLWSTFLLLILPVNSIALDFQSFLPSISNTFDDFFSSEGSLLDKVVRLSSEIGTLEIAVIAFILALLAPFIGFKKKSGRWFTWPLMADSCLTSFAANVDSGCLQAAIDTHQYISWN